MEKPKIIRSSQDPTQIAARIKGIVVALSSTIILVAGSVFGITLSGADVLQLGTQLGGVVGAIYSVYGGILWFITFLGTKWENKG